MLRCFTWHGILHVRSACLLPFHQKRGLKHFFCQLNVIKRLKKVPETQTSATMSGVNSSEDNGKLANEDITEENYESINGEPVPGHATFDSYLEQAFAAVQAGIKSANNLPNGDNYNYYSCFPSFRDIKQTETNRLMNIIQHLCGTIGLHAKFNLRDTDEKFQLLVDANDKLIDRANVCMDEESGITGNLNPELEKQCQVKDTSGSWNTKSYTGVNKNNPTSKFVQVPSKVTEKPQAEFKDKVDNSLSPWYPKIKEKPNAITPLHIQLIEDENGEYYNHPYQVELEKFVPPDSQLQKRTPIAYKPLHETPLILVNKPSDVRKMLDDLKNQKEIAIDLEHHSHRSFQGITCLMQLTSPETDYIIDTLALRDQLYELNEVFTNPKILKVLHGASSDILWMQRDLSLYIVNMFDTHQAAVQLEMPFASLAYLLRRYCSVQPNKHLRLADWRIRPLPENLLTYAREDTHYLLHIKDHLINELIDKANGQTNLLKAVYKMSTNTCQKIYMKPVFNEKSYFYLYRQSKKMFNNKQLYALQELYKWRDMTAREQDDSLGYVLPTHMLLCIAETLPREMQGILACCNPIPPLVRKDLLTLHKIVLNAREQPLIKPQLKEHLRQRLAQRNHTTDSEVASYNPHDIPSGSEPRTDLPCLLDEKYTDEEVVQKEAVKHQITIFDSPVTSEDEETLENARTPKKKASSFVNPFHRYKRAVAMATDLEAEEREKQKQKEKKELAEMQKREEETKDSISRVHEHFKQVVGSMNQDPQKQANKIKKAKLPLSQMEGGKKKMSVTTNKKDSEVGTSSNFETPVPQLDKKISSGIKRKRNDNDDDVRIINVAANKSDVVTPFRKKRGKELKDEREANLKELESKGMLPSSSFNYKAVDFSSFQGGSKNSSNQVHFQQNTQKKNKQGKRKKKPKINI